MQCEWYSIFERDILYLFFMIQRQFCLPFFIFASYTSLSYVSLPSALLLPTPLADEDRNLGKFDSLETIEGFG